MSNKIYDAFDKIKAEEQLKVNTRDFIEKQYQTSSFRYKCYIPVASVLLLMFAFVPSYFVYRTPVSFISLDVNPSIELKINCFNRVVDAEAYNMDGNSVLSNVNVINKEYWNAIKTYIESEALNVYLDKDYFLSMTIVSQKDDDIDKISTTLKKEISLEKYDAQIVSTDLETMEEAHTHHMSFGKYTAYKELLMYEPELTVEACHSMTMYEIFKEIDNHCHEKENDAEACKENHEQGHHHSH